MAADFFVVPTVAFRLRYVLIILSHERSSASNTRSRKRTNAAALALTTEFRGGRGDHKLSVRRERGFGNRRQRAGERFQKCL
jgi:hypothetical protein